MDLLVVHQEVVVITEEKIFWELFLIAQTQNHLEMVIEEEYRTVTSEDQLVATTEETMEGTEAMVEALIEDNQMATKDQMEIVTEEHQEAHHLEDQTMVEDNLHLSNKLIPLDLMDFLTKIM